MSLRVLCLNAADGKTVWDVEVLRPDPASVRAMHQKNSHASPTPIVDGGRIYAHFGHLGTACLDLPGKVLWRQTTLKYPPVHGNGGSPVLVERAARLQLRRRPRPVRRRRWTRRPAKVQWKTAAGRTRPQPFSFCTPLVIEVGGKKQVDQPGQRRRGRYDPDTGKEIWRVRYGEGYSVVPRPVYGHGLLIRQLRLRHAGPVRDPARRHGAT